MPAILAARRSDVNVDARAAIGQRTQRKSSQAVHYGVHVRVQLFELRQMRMNSLAVDYHVAQRSPSILAIDERQRVVAAILANGREQLPAAGPRQIAVPHLDA